MPRHELRFRQVHLDFHTSPHIEGIGEKFDKKLWQETLKSGRVNSITCFSKCHHGWSYHPTRVGRMHPHLGFDLLRAQFEACKEIDVNVPIYLSAGVDNFMAEEHPEWREIGIGGNYIGWTGPINQPGFKTMCFNTAYLDYLCEQIREVVDLFPGCDGIFLDIIHQGECCCPACLKYMDEHGLDPDKQEDRKACAQAALERYFRMSTEACRQSNPDMPVFHNSGHIAKGNRDVLKYFSHLELESLPTGGWGYDHFPLSAKYAEQTGLDVLGMTGKFHTTWGEFGGFKHPNALRYECAAMLAFGSKCSVGDQLHPNGALDGSTYRIIGAAYSEVEQKEAWCTGTSSCADIGLLSSESEKGEREPDTGAGRILLEGHFLFDVIDRQCDFGKYKMLVLPDVITIDEEIERKLRAYLESGGKLFLSGRSGLKNDETGFALDVGATYHGESEFQPDYVEMGSLAPEFVSSPVVMYMRSQRVKATTGEAISRIWEPYFNRTWKHFCSHQHAPHARLSEYAGAVRNGSVMYLAHPVFSLYHASGAVAYKDYVVNALRFLLGDDESVHTNLPSTARVSLMDQPSKKRFILHLLYANTIARGAYVKLSPDGYVRDSNRLEVIEDLVPLRDIRVSLKLPRQIKAVSLEPQGKELAPLMKNGVLEITVDEFTCHQMVVMAY